MKPVVRVNEWWLSRDGIGSPGWPKLFTHEPIKHYGGLWMNKNGDYIASGTEQVKRLVGHYHGVRPGQCKKIRVKTTIEAEVVE